jgi:Fe(3+) dicitrate transport protein
MKKIITLSLFITIYNNLQSQKKDSLSDLNLQDIIITDVKLNRMPDLKDNVIYAGKKNEIIYLNKINADLSTNNARQIFAKVPGISVWENDGSGIQTGIASRGLSPNRSWEFNVRQNGYDISPDIFGYPESYYTPPTEAVEKIEVVRGAASLQYGPQFGGLLNYELKKPNAQKPITFETQQTIGSYGLFNSFNAISGTIKKFSYYGFMHHRHANGWRNNSRYSIFTGHISLNYQFTKKISITAEYTNMNYDSQQPGGLTDVEFNKNHQQSFRERNWFGAPWNVASAIIKYKVSNSFNIQLKSFTTIAERNSVGYLKSINFKDSINPSKLQYNTRQVDRDYYENYGTELRTSLKYNLFGKQHTLAGGIRAQSAHTNRNQLGGGSTGNDFDLNLIYPQQYGRSLNFTTTNFALFAENIFYVGNKLKIIPGLRFDYIENTIKGYINTSSTGQLNPEKRTRNILLYGIGGEFLVTKKTNLYANYSLAYRPVTFSELTPSATTEIIDPNLQDASGFNIDLGYRGKLTKFFTFDISAFYLQYNNRIGSITQNGNLFRTNIGTSVSKGIESYIELSTIDLFTEKSRIGYLTVFASNSFINAIYTKWNNPSISSDPIKSIENKRVENAPKYIHRFGATYTIQKLSLSFQYNAVGDVFTDAANTELANATATIGKLSGYNVMDVSLAYQFLEIYNLKAGINNLTDEKYATRRSGGYPGPGILPGNARTYFISFGASF